MKVPWWVSGEMASELNGGYLGKEQQGGLDQQKQTHRSRNKVTCHCSY